MKSNEAKRRKIDKRVLLGLGVILLAGLSAGGFLLWQNQVRPAAATAEAQINSAVVRRGDLVISVAASGTLVASQSANLSFPTEGEVVNLTVKPGDRVSEGQALAELADKSSLQTSLTLAELDLKAAEDALNELTNGSAATLATAQLALAEAKKTYLEAQSDVVTESLTRCDQETTDTYFSEYMRALDELEKLQADKDNPDHYLTYIVPAKVAVDEAYATYEYCAGYTEYEIDSSHAEVVLAKAAVDDAQKTLDTLIANNGVDPQELAQAQNDAAAAQIAYDDAVGNLKGAILTAPFDGTIISVAGENGDRVETDTFIVVADLGHPLVEIYVDESDLASVAVGMPASVVFDAFPDTTFDGEVIQINPVLETVDGYQVLSGQVRVEPTDGGEVICSSKASAQRSRSSAERRWMRCWCRWKPCVTLATVNTAFSWLVTMGNCG
jgi:multidrug resistance efflux pump